MRRCTCERHLPLCKCVVVDKLCRICASEYMHMRTSVVYVYTYVGASTLLTSFAVPRIAPSNTRIAPLFTRIAPLYTRILPSYTHVGASTLFTSFAAPLTSACVYKCSAYMH